MENNLEFNGFPVILSMDSEHEVYAECKGVKGSLTESEAFINKTNNDGNYTFGIAKISRVKNLVYIDCLTDSIKKFEYIVKRVKIYREKELLKLKQK